MWGVRSSVRPTGVCVETCVDQKCNKLLPVQPRDTKTARDSYEPKVRAESVQSGRAHLQVSPYFAPTPPPRLPGRLGGTAFDCGTAIWPRAHPSDSRSHPCCPSRDFDISGGPKGQAPWKFESSYSGFAASRLKTPKRTGED